MVSLGVYAFGVICGFAVCAIMTGGQRRKCKKEQKMQRLGTSRMLKAKELREICKCGLIIKALRPVAVIAIKKK